MSNPFTVIARWFARRTAPDACPVNPDAEAIIARHTRRADALARDDMYGYARARAAEHAAALARRAGERGDARA